MELVWQIHWDDKDYVFEPNKIDVATAMVIRDRSRLAGSSESGWGYKTWLTRIDDGDPLALQFLLWSMKKGAGEQCDPLTLQFNVGEFWVEVNRAAGEAFKQVMAAEAQKQEGKKSRPPRKSSNGKPSSGSTRTSRTTGGATSDSSATS